MNATGSPILARPFYNVDDNAPDTGLIAYPGALSGNVSVVSTTSLHGAGLAFRRNWFYQPGSRVDYLIGYRYLQLEDGLRMNEFETFIDPQGVVQVNSTLAITDIFDTRNQFHGANLGLRGMAVPALDVESAAQVGLGNTNSEATIQGTTTATVPGTAAVVSPAGFLAQQSNIGAYNQDWFTMVPELGLTLAYDLTSWCRFTVGYSLVYWSKVARPGDQIDLHLHPKQFPVPLDAASELPEFPFATTDYWAQGLNLGLDVRF